MYALTPRQKEEHLSWAQRPATFAIVVLAMTALLNFVFF